MSEAKLQAKILRWLKVHDYYAFKTVVCNRNGISDIIGCTPSGVFFAIEVKFGANKASPLQQYNIDEIRQRGGIALVAWSLEEVIEALT